MPLCTCVRQSGALTLSFCRSFSPAPLDVIIIGAGLAGLAAADVMKRANRSFVVLEARAV